MTVIVRDGTNTPRTISEIVVRDGTNTPRTISEIRVRDSNNVSRIVYSTGADFSASADPTDVFGFDAGSGTATTNVTTVTAVGGVSPYTYAWTVTSPGWSPSPIVNAPTSASTTFTQTGLSPGAYSYASFQCVVTDNLGATFPVEVAATFYSSGLTP